MISGAVAAIDHNFITPQHLSEAAAGSLSGWAVSCALLGCVIGAIVGGPISTMFGRKGGLLVAAVLFFLGSIGSAWPEFGLGTIGAMGPAALTPFIIYRIIGGIGVGMASMISPLYIAEIAPPNDRGRLVTFQQIAIVTGILLVYFVNYFIASQGTDAWILSTGWRYMLASEAIPAMLFFLLMLTAPDTPRWFVLKGQDAKALAILRRITDEATAQATLKDIEGTLVVRTRPLLSFGALVLFVGVMLSVFPAIHRHQCRALLRAVDVQEHGSLDQQLVPANRGGRHRDARLHARCAGDGGSLGPQAAAHHGRRHHGGLDVRHRLSVQRRSARRRRHARHDA